MENKPVFCSECGAKLTGSATFCSACGTKQAAAPAAPVSAPAAAAAAAPETSLAAPKNKLSVFGLIATLLAVGAALLAIILYICQMTVLMGRDFSNIGLLILRSSSLGMVAAFVVPAFALVCVIARNKKLAVVGLIAALVSLGLQFIVCVAYPFIVRGGVPLARLNFILRPLNGETLFSDLGGLFRSGANTGKETVRYLLSAGASALYLLKNILAAVGCLMAAAKKK